MKKVKHRTILQSKININMKTIYMNINSLQFDNIENVSFKNFLCLIIGDIYMEDTNTLDRGNYDSLNYNEISVEKNGLTPEIYEKVRFSVGMEYYQPKDVEIALKNTLFSVVIKENNIPIGIGRVIGDGRVAFFIKDVAIVPSKQKNGIGTLIMENLMAYIKEVGAPNAYVGLMSLSGKEKFYSKFGFHVRPYKNEGSGMTQYLNR